MKIRAITLSAIAVILSLNGCGKTEPKVKKVTIESIEEDACKSLKAKDYTNANKKYAKAEKMGSANSAQSLGLMYIYGHGVKRDYAKAMHYFKKAYSAGRINSAYDIGVMYRNGEGVKKDRDIAKKYYLIAAKNGYGLAQGELAMIYGEERNREKFIYWGKKAQTKGYVFKSKV